MWICYSILNFLRFDVNLFVFQFFSVDYIMEATGGEGERHETPDKCKSPTQVIKEWTPFCKRSWNQKPDWSLPTWKNVRNSINLMLIMLVLAFVNQHLRRLKKASTSITTMFALNKYLGELEPMSTLIESGIDWGGL